MNIENSTIEEIESVLYNYYLNSYLSNRNEAIELLKNKNFDELKREYSWYITKKDFFQQLDSISINDVIEELKNFITPENCDTPRIESKKIYFDVENDSLYGNDFETIIAIEWYLYEIITIEKCESLAKHYAIDRMWRIKNQVGYKETNGILELLKKL